jgi:eukaryotic-like serine/threonine-protein kinase
MTAHIVQFLRNSEAFRSLSEDSLQRLAIFVHVEAFTAGTWLVREGEAGTCMFVICEGRIQIPIDGRDGKPKFTAWLGAGDVFGEMALMTEGQRNADVIADTDCKCIVVPKSVVTQLLSDHPEVASFLTNILGKRLMEGRGIQHVGKFRLTGEIIGKGGMATVFEGIHSNLDRPVAIKMLSHTLIYRRHFAERFRNEARIIAGLRHPNIVEVYDREEAYATIFIIMEKLTGRDVEQILDEKGKLPATEVRRVLRDVASALAFAHAHGIVHRDVKPSNIIIQPDGVVKLTDFGIAAIDGVEEGMTRDKGIYLGTPVYSSPEHAMGLVVDGRSDVYALGIVAYEMLTGLLPFDDDDIQKVLRQHIEVPMPDPRVHVSDIPQDLIEFIFRATAKDPAQRYQSANDIVDFFERTQRISTLPHQVSLKTFGIIYSPDVETEVQELVQRFRLMAERINGVSFRSSG